MDKIIKRYLGIDIKVAKKTNENIFNLTTNIGIWMWGTFGYYLTSAEWL